MSRSEKDKGLKIRCLSCNLKKVGEDQFYDLYKEKGIIKIRVGISEIENNKSTEKANETKVSSFQRSIKLISS